MPFWDEDEDDGDEDPAHALPVPEGEWGNIPSLWGRNDDLRIPNMGAGRWGTRFGAKVMAVAGPATTAAAHAHGVGVAVGAGAAVAGLGAGTGGIALAAAAGALTVGGMALGGRSFAKTWNHIDEIRKMLGPAYACHPLSRNFAENPQDHGHIQQNIIPYILAKKSAKRAKKLAAGFALGMPVAVYGFGKKIYKYQQGTLGKRRTFYAHVIARHMNTYDCALCAALVSELYSPAEYDQLKRMGTHESEEWIALKMKSN